MINKEISFNKEKFKQVLHFIISKVGTLDNVGKTVIFKILYFSDFDNHELKNEPITGEKYFKLPHGPAPSHFDSAISELEKEKKVEEYKVSCGSHKDNMIKFISTSEPTLTKINAEELKIILKVIQRLSGMNATQISAYSHEDLPWKATEDKKEINYDLVFYRDETYSVEEEPLVC